MSLEKVIADLAQKVDQRVYGKYRGFVVDNADPQQLGRLKVQVQDLLGKKVVIGWAMPCVPFGGGADQGFLFIPEVGAGVWVEFEKGDLEFPIWVGTFWGKPGGESELPRPNGAVQDPPTQKIIKTAKGHTIQLEDADGEEKITIKHKDNSFISIDKDGSVIIGNHKGSTIILNAKDENIVLVEQHGNALTMTEDGVVIVYKDGSAVVELSGDKALVAAKEITLEGSTVTLGAGAAENLPPEPAVLGQTFALMYNTHTHSTAVGPSGPPIPAPLLLDSEPAGKGLSSTVLVK